MPPELFLALKEEKETLVAASENEQTSYEQNLLKFYHLDSIRQSSF